MEINDKLVQKSSKNLNVLYVEDDSVVRESTLGLLYNFFNNIDIAEDGEIGYKKYKEKVDNNYAEYDLIITDIDMPNMDGMEMSKKIKKLQHNQVIIFITVFNETKYLNNAIEIGINGFLTKPLEIKNLKSVLYTVTKIIADQKLMQNHYAQIEELNMLHIDIKDARTFKNSKDILKDLEENKENISKLWMGKEVVYQRLENHFIDVEFFRTHYALKVIEYFLSVIREENESGNCPVIFVMLEFFKNKDLPLKDIFMICVSFKNTVSSYVFNKYSFNQNLFDDISMILDKNFEGVIVNYLDIKYEKKSDEIEKNNKNNIPIKSNKKIKGNFLTSNKKPSINIEKMTYTEYVLEHDVYELQDLEEEIDTLGISVTSTSKATINDFNILGNKIKRYGEILNNYPLFSELGQYIIKLGLNFASNAQLLFDDKERMLNIAALIEGFVNDLIIWRREIFDNNIDNPHFLDQSFFSNVDTIIIFIEYDESKVAEDEDFDDMFF